MGSLEEFKHLLSDDTHRIQLFDYVDQHCSVAIQRLSSEELEHPPKWDAAGFESHLEQVQEITSDLRAVMALLGFWSPPSHRRLVTLHRRHFSQWLASASAHKIGSSLKWYPLLIQVYALGLGAVSSNSFEVLHSFIESPYPDPTSRMLRIPQILAVSSGLSRAQDLFKMLPDRERQFTPLSEYLFDFFKSALDGIIFFGSDYEYVFDRFEVLFALQHSHLNAQIHEGRFWGPVGRFGWKFLRRGGPNPYDDLYQDASRARESWPPIKAGFFGGDFNRFEGVLSNYTEHLKQLPWH